MAFPLPLPSPWRQALCTRRCLPARPTTSASPPYAATPSLLLSREMRASPNSKAWWTGPSHRRAPCPPQLPWQDQFNILACLLDPVAGHWRPHLRNDPYWAALLPVMETATRASQTVPAPGQILVSLSFWPTGRPSLILPQGWYSPLLWEKYHCPGCALGDRVNSGL